MVELGFERSEHPSSQTFGRFLVNWRSQYCHRNGENKVFAASSLTMLLENPSSAGLQKQNETKQKNCWSPKNSDQFTLPTPKNFLNPVHTETAPRPLYWNHSWAKSCKRRLKTNKALPLETVRSGSFLKVRIKSDRESVKEPE